MFAGQRTPPDTLVCNVAIHSTDTLVNYIHLLSVRKKISQKQKFRFSHFSNFFADILQKNILSNVLNYKLFVNIFVLY